MKKMKKILSLIMVMILALSLAGCGGNSASELYGTWATTFDISSLYEEEMGSDFEGFHEELNLTWMMDFNEDGTFRMYVDEAALTDSVNTYIDSMATFATQAAYDQILAQSEEYTREDVDSLFEEQFGMGVKDYMLSELQSSIDVESMVNGFETSGVYEAKGNKLYMDEVKVSANVYDLFTVDGDKLTIDAAGEVDSEELLDGFDYPYVFNRVK